MKARITIEVELLTALPGISAIDVAVAIQQTLQQNSQIRNEIVKVGGLLNSARDGSIRVVACEEVP